MSIKPLVRLAAIALAAPLAGAQVLYSYDDGSMNTAAGPPGHPLAPEHAAGKVPGCRFNGQADAKVAHIDRRDAEFEALLRVQNGFEDAPVVGTPVVALAGLLVPDPESPGRWLLVPRTRSDAVLGQPPTGG